MKNGVYMDNETVSNIQFYADSLPFTLSVMIEMLIRRELKEKSIQQSINKMPFIGGLL